MKLQIRLTEPGFFYLILQCTECQEEYTIDDLKAIKWLISKNKNQKCQLCNIKIV